MPFIEHNNRKIADEYAEFITSDSLRKFVADRVSSYLGDRHLKVFDGCVGSGQLLQYLKINSVFGIDIQIDSIAAFKANFSNIDCEGISGDFFLNVDDAPNKFDCVVMNPPFSLSYKDCSDDARVAISQLMPYPKKSGKLDECFYVVASKKARYSFFIAFPGVSYRAQEKKMRHYFGNSISEIVWLKNGFSDTQISTILFVVDRDKKSDLVDCYNYDCSSGEVNGRSSQIIDLDTWNKPSIEQKKEEIDIVQITNELSEVREKNRIAMSEFDELVRSLMTKEQIAMLR